MTTLRLIPFALLCAGCTAPAPRTDPPVPEQAARLSVAKCSEPAPRAVTDYSQRLKPRGQLKLYAKPELEGVIGGVDRELLYGRKVKEGVWAVLVTDYDKKVCEVYLNEESAELMNNEPGPEPMDAGISDGDAGPDPDAAD